MNTVELPLGTIVAAPKGIPWLKREDGWYVGDIKQPNAKDMSGFQILRLGWEGRVDETNSSSSQPRPGRYEHDRWP